MAAPLVPPPRSSSREPARGNSIEPNATSENAVDAQEFSEKGDGSGKRSVTERRRDNSRGSKRSANARTNAAERPRSAGAPAPMKAKKKGGFLSFLNCCASSGDDDDETASPDSAPKSNAPRTNATRARSPQHGDQQNASATNTSADSREVFDEKQGHGYDSATANTAPVTNARQPEKQKEEETKASTSDTAPVAAPLLDTTAIAPTLNVQAPTPNTPQNQEEDSLIADRTPQQAQRDTDIEMTDAGPSIPLSTAEVPHAPEDETEVQPRKSSESARQVDLPPPPPLAERQAQTQAAQPTETSIAFSPEPSRKWLLPPIKSDLSGRKCLVLDLDETLVHSSFKV